MNDLPMRFGQYEVLNVIGYGSFGTVYLARDTGLGDQVILKVLRADFATDQAMVKWFEHDAKALARLHHPNLVMVCNFDVEHSPPYLVTELSTSSTLETYLQQKPITISEALPLLRQIAAVLDVAHVNGLVHRALNPSNILITPSGHVQLIDFGLIKRTPSVEVSWAGSDATSSMVCYMAPEQADINRQDEIGPATDIYAFGVVTYQMLTARLPFEGTSPAVMAAHRAALPPNARLFNRKLPPPLANVLMKVLAKQPKNRFTSAAAFLKALEQAVSNDNPTRTLFPASNPTGPQPTDKLSSEPPPLVPTSSKKQYRKWAKVLLLLLMLAFLGKISANRVILSNDASVVTQTESESESQNAAPSLPDAQVQAQEGLYLRTGPGLQYEIIAIYPQDTALRVVGREPQAIWLQVETPDGQGGWMFADLLKVNVPLDDVPFVPLPAAPLQHQL